VNSIANKLNYVFNLIQDESLDVVAVTETWLTTQCSDSFVAVPGYSLYRGDVRGDVRKHGAGLYITDELKHVGVKVDIPNVAAAVLIDYDLHVLSIYRPPSYSQGENQALLEFLQQFMMGKEVIVLGDFNLPSLRWSDNSVLDSYVSPTDRLFHDCFTECGLVQWVNFGTFFPSGNILDLVLTTEEDRVGEVYHAPPLPGCHHCPVVCTVVFTFDGDHVRPISAEKLSWARADFESISEELLGVCWETEFSGMEVQYCYSFFLQILNESVSRYVPHKAATRGGKWLSVPPRALEARRRRDWMDYKETRLRCGRMSSEATESLQLYMETNREYRNYAIHRQSKYEEKLANLLSRAPKLFHGYLRERKMGCPSVGPLRTAGELTYDHREMSEEFATAFSRVFVVTDPQNPHPHQRFVGAMDEIDIGYEGVLKVLESLSDSSSPGPDGVHPAILKHCATVIALPLTLIIRKTLDAGTLPAEWKKSRVVPIFKSGSKYVPLNYRPVSLTSCPCKVAERLVVAHITDYLDRWNIISPKQFGFRRGHSVEDQLLMTYSEIATEIDRGGEVDVVYLDFSKAFDVISHILLLEMLTSLGFCDQIVAWIHAFLRGRTMQVSVGGCDSRTVGVPSGVPQGSVLGPLLFILYVNSLGVEFGCRWYAFADDLKIYASVKRSGTGTVSDALQQDLDLLCRIALSWNLRLNPDKCVIVKFGGVSATARGEGTSGYTLGGEPLRAMPSHRDLGVLVDNRLRFHQHIATIVRKASGLLNQLLRSTVCRTPEFMVTLWVSHIRPLLDFASPVWNVGYLGDLAKMEALQRRWTREVRGLAGVEYPHRLRRLGLFSVKGRLLRADLIKVWKAFNSEIDVGLGAMFERLFHPATRGHNLKLSVPRCRSEISRRFFNVRVVPTWNSLPATVVEAESVHSFKTRLDAHLEDVFYTP